VAIVPRIYNEVGMRAVKFSGGGSVAFTAVALLMAAAGGARAADVVGGAQAVNILNQIRNTGGARIWTGDVRDASGNVVQRFYRDVIAIDGKGMNTSDVAIVVRYSEDKRLDPTPVYTYPIWYVNPQTNTWVHYFDTQDLTYATNLINWMRATYHVQTWCTPVQTGWRFVEPPLVRPALNSAPGAVGVGNPVGPGLLGVPMAH
jgi:hypothetical protein